MVATADEIAACAAFEVDVNLENVTTVALFTDFKTRVARLTMSAAVHEELNTLIDSLSATLIADAAAAEAAVLIEVA